MLWLLICHEWLDLSLSYNVIKVLCNVVETLEMWGLLLYLECIIFTTLVDISRNNVVVTNIFNILFQVTILLT